jgi:hypothetical protein
MSRSWQQELAGKIYKQSHLKYHFKNLGVNLNKEVKDLYTEIQLEQAGKKKK